MIHAYPPAHNAGAELTMQALLEHLVDRGHSVDVQLSAPTPLGDYTRNQVRVHSPRGNADPLVHINRGVDVILTHLENTTRAAVLGEIHGIPTVHVLHNTDDFGKHCLRRGRSDLAVFNTEWMAEDFATWFANAGLKLPPQVMMHPAVFGEAYRANPIKDTRQITLINLWEGKGGDLFWELAKRLPGKEFLGVTGAYGEQVTGDLPNVEVVPHQPPDSMQRVYAWTKILLMPSRYESYGRVAVEASFSGIPTIAHPTPGLLEALGDGGTFCDREDPDAWVAAIKRLSTPKGYAKASKAALAVAARQTPTEDLDRVCNAIEEAAGGYFALARRAG